MFGDLLTYAAFFHAVMAIIFYLLSLPGDRRHVRLPAVSTLVFVVGALILRIAMGSGEHSDSLKILFFLSIAGSATSLCFLLAALPGHEGLKAAARISYGAALALATIAIAYLSWLFMTDRFEFLYVRGYSSSDLGAGLKFSALWAGQEGTFLLWLFFAMLLGVWVKFKSGKEEGILMPVYILLQLFLFILMFVKSPFAHTAFAPPDGQGLNPLLQNFWMVIHPPIVFVGYAALAVPFAFALVALLRNRYDDWVRVTMPWVLFSVITLGAGIFIGGYWAYETLGWGGYWAWDPVENASLIPWLTSVALMHGMLIERSKKTLRKTNIFLALLGFLLVIYGTFLTRSGVLADFSVHSFADLGLNSYLVGFLLIFSIFSLGLLALKSRRIASAEFSPSALSYEFLIFIGVVVILISALFVLLGTSLPILTGFFGAKAVNIIEFVAKLPEGLAKTISTPSSAPISYYNFVHLPLAILMLAAVSIVPTIRWTRKRADGSRNNMVVTAITVFSTTVVAGMLFGLFLDAKYASREVLYAMCYFTALTAIVMSIVALVPRIRNGFTATGGFIAHVGLGVMVIGILASSVLGSRERVALPFKEEGEALGYKLSFADTVEVNEKKTDIIITAAKDGKVHQLKARFTLGPQGTVRSPAIKTYLFADIYFSPEQVRFVEDLEGAERLKLTKGESQTLGEWEITFAGFDMSSHNETGEMRVGTYIDVSNSDSTYQLNPALVFASDGDKHPESVAFPDGRFLTVDAIHADDGAITVRISDQPGSQAEKMVLTLDVSTKPLINLVWLGVILMTGGVFVGYLRRF